MTGAAEAGSAAAPGWPRLVWARLLEAVGALGLLSVVPLPRAATGRPTAVTVAAFAPAGLVLGAAAGGIDAGLAPVFGVGPRSALVLAALLALSGALHLDGLTDSADGLFGGRTVERRLEIMRDSRIGGYGMAAAAAVVLCQYAALSTLTAGRVGALVTAVGLSRSATAVALAAARPARRDGLGAAFTVRGRLAAGAVAALVALAAAVLLSGWRGLLAAAAVAVVAGGVVAAFRRRVGGLTGDGCGAIAELGLAVALLALAARR